MKRPREQGVRISLLDDLAGIHDDHPATCFGDDAEIVGYEKHRHSEVLLEPHQELQYLGLDRHYRAPSSARRR